MPQQQRPAQQPYGQPMQQRPVQQPYGQPVYNNYQQPYAMPPQKKKGKGVIIAIIAVILLAAIGAGIFFILRSRQGDTNTDTKTNTDANKDIPETVNYYDVDETDWYYDAVMWAARNGIAGGNMFLPEEPCERAQALTFLWRTKGMPKPSLKVSPFTDVTEKDYFYKPVLWAFENGLISVSDDGQFHPGDATTRAQAVTFLYRAEGPPAQSGTSSFGDVGTDEWYAPAVIWAESRGLISPDSSFNPEDACVRAVYITFLYRCYK